MFPWQHMMKPQSEPEVLLTDVCVAVTASAQLLEQTARLRSLRDTLDRLKVGRVHGCVCSSYGTSFTSCVSTSGRSCRTRRQPAAWSSSVVRLCHVSFDLVREGTEILTRHREHMNIQRKRCCSVSGLYDVFVVQAKEEKQGDMVLVGRVTVPCPRGQEQVHRLVLSQCQLQRVHGLLRS